MLNLKKQMMEMTLKYAKQNLNELDRIRDDLIEMYIEKKEKEDIEKIQIILNNCDFWEKQIKEIEKKIEEVENKIQIEVN